MKTERVRARERRYIHREGERERKREGDAKKSVIADRPTKTAHCDS